MTRKTYALREWNKRYRDGAYRPFHDPNNPFLIRSEGLAKMSQSTINKYTRRIGPKLKAFIEEHFNSENHLDARAELAMLRYVNGERLALLSIVLETQFPDTPEGRRDRDSAKQLAEQIVMESNMEVISACERVAKIDALAGGKTSPYAIEAVVKQVSRFVHRIFDAEPIAEGDSPDVIAEKTAARKRMELFERALDEELELPMLATRGTTITPDMQVRAMDDTIPFCEAEAEECR